MFGEANSIMCLYKDTIHTSQNQSRIYEDFNTPYVGIPYILVTMFISTSNFMLIYGFYKTSRPFTIITKLFIYLSIVDTLFIMFTTLYIFIIFLDSLECWVIYLVAFTSQFLYFLDISIFATISFLRCLSIKKPLHSINSNRLTFVLIVLIIVCGLTSGSLFVVFFVGENLKEKLKINYSLPVSQFLAVAFVLTVNITSYKKLKSMKKNSGLSDNVVNTSTQRQKILSEANTCLLYITVFYIICPLPTFIVNLLDQEQLLSHSWGIYVFRLTYIIYLSNTGINSFIVIWRTRNLREFYRMKCWLPRWVKKNSATELATIQEL